jgi:hypothetical protein
VRGSTLAEAMVWIAIGVLVVIGIAVAVADGFSNLDECQRVEGHSRGYCYQLLYGRRR